MQPLRRKKPPGNCKKWIFLSPGGITLVEKCRIVTEIELDLDNMLNLYTKFHLFQYLQSLRRNELLVGRLGDRRTAAEQYAIPSSKRWGGGHKMVDINLLGCEGPPSFSFEKEKLNADLE